VVVVGSVSFTLVVSRRRRDYVSVTETFNDTFQQRRFADSTAKNCLQVVNSFFVNYSGVLSAARGYTARGFMEGGLRCGAVALTERGRHVLASSGSSSM